MQQDSQVVSLSFFQCIMEEKKIKREEEKLEKWGESCVRAGLHNRPRSFPSQKKSEAPKEDGGGVVEGGERECGPP